MVSQNTSLIVPLRLSAMTVGSAASDLVQCGPSADFSLLQACQGEQPTAPYTTAVVAGQWRPKATSTGIHLHWNLPAALRSGTAHHDGRMTMPAVPNRWMVVRIDWGSATPGPDAVPTCTPFLVESDFTWPAGSIPTQTGFPIATLPLAPTWNDSQEMANPLFQCLGRSYAFGPAPQPPSGSGYLDLLTAIGYGTPEFSSYLPNCYNVFGYCDAGPADATTLSYVVLGWYSASANDPLSSGTGPKSWTYAADAGYTPDSSIYFGMISGLAWNPSGEVAPAGGAFNGNLAIGNSAIEALSALIADGAPTQEQTMNAVQTALWQEAASATYAAKVAKATQLRGLKAQAGGKRWTVKPSAANPSATRNPSIAQALAALNQAEAEADRLDWEFETLAGQLYSDWSNYLTIVVDQTQVNFSPDIFLNQFLHQSKELIDKTKNEAAAARSKAEGLEAQLKALLVATAPEAQLHSHPAEPHNAPHDHVMLLASSSGAAVAIPPDVTASQLDCFLAANQPIALTLPAGLIQSSAEAGISTADILAASTWNLPDLSLAACPAVSAQFTGLVALGLLFDPLAAAPLAALIAAKGGSGNPAVLDPTVTTTQIAAFSTAACNPAETYSGLNGVAISASVTLQPGIGLGQAGLPSNPVMLAWTAQYTGNASLVDESDDYASSAILDNFQWSTDGLELELTNAPTLGGTPVTMTGAVPFSPAASINLLRELQSYLNFKQSSTLSAILEKWSGVPLIAQSLSGFHDALAQRIYDLQMPAFDNSSSHDATGSLVRFINETLKSAAKSTPQPLYPYNILRSSQIDYTSLSLVDEMGLSWQVEPTGDGTFYTPTTIDATLLSENNGYQVQVSMPTLRLSQPSRLNFQLDERPTAVSGWVVPSSIGPGLSFYDADGHPIGALSAPDGDLVWSSAPGTNPVGQSFEDAFAKCDPALRAMAQAVHSAGGGYLTQMVEAALAAAALIVPPISQTNAAAALLGTPLALVKARLSMELRGKPWPDQSYSGLAHTNNPGDRPHRKLLSVQFPVQVGQIENLEDGLIGYFIMQPTLLATKGYDAWNAAEWGNPASYGTFYCEAADTESGATESTGTVVAPGFKTLSVCPGTDGGADIAMLVDPRCSVSATNGLGPVRSAALAPEQYQPALANLRFYFLAAPVLQPQLGGDGADVVMPAPKGGVRRWRWYQVSGGLQATEGGDIWTESRILPVSDPAVPTPAQSLIEGWLVTRQKGEQ